MRRFTAAGQAQRCLSAPDRITNLVQLRRDYVTATEYRAARAAALAVGAEVTGGKVAA